MPGTPSGESGCATAFRFAPFPLFLLSFEVSCGDAEVFPLFVRTSLCGRCRFHGLGEVRRTLLQERRKRLLCVVRANLRAELFVLGLHCRLDLFAKWLLHEPLGGLQRASRL